MCLLGKVNSLYISKIFTLKILQNSFPLNHQLPIFCYHNHPQIHLSVHELRSHPSQTPQFFNLESLMKCKNNNYEDFSF